MIYVRQCLDKLKVVPVRLHVASHVCIRKRFTSEICLTKVWSKIIHGDNQPAPRPPTTSFSGKTFSGKTFFFSTSWKNWRFPIWLKNVNPKCYAVKCHGKTRAWYAHTNWNVSKHKKIKTFFRIKLTQRCYFFHGTINLYSNGLYINLYINLYIRKQQVCLLRNDNLYSIYNFQVKSSQKCVQLPKICEIKCKDSLI